MSITLKSNPSVDQETLSAALTNAAAEDTVIITGESISAEMLYSANKAIAYSIENSTISDVTATGHTPILIRATGTVSTISGSTISNCNSQDKFYGGALEVATGAELSVTGSVFDNCSVGANNNSGGAIYVNNNGTVTISGSTFSNNFSRTGAIYVDATGVMTIGDAVFSGNTWGTDGVCGAFRSQGTTYINGLITLATANDSIYNGGAFTLTVPPSSAKTKPLPKLSMPMMQTGVKAEQVIFTLWMQIITPKSC